MVFRAPPDGRPAPLGLNHITVPGFDDDDLLISAKHLGTAHPQPLANSLNPLTTATSAPSAPATSYLVPHAHLTTALNHDNASRYTLHPKP